MFERNEIINDFKSVFRCVSINSKNITQKNVVKFFFEMFTDFKNGIGVDNNKCVARGLVNINKLIRKIFR